MSAPMVAGSACAQSADDIGEALTQPLRDLSILRRETPEPLQRAAIAPYADGPTLPNGDLDCATVASEIASLDLALGDDVDLTISRTSLMARARAEAGDAVVDAIGDLVELPYRNVIRWLSGADRRDREMREAVQAGTVRRAFLKGLSARECAASQSLALVEPVTETPLSDLELAHIQLAAANAAAAARISAQSASAAGASNDVMTFAAVAPVPELERPGMRHVTASVAATAPREEWSQRGEGPLHSAASAAQNEARLSDLQLARMQLAAANTAAAAAALESWTPLGESLADGGASSAASEARLSDLELARRQLAAANAAAAAASELWSPPVERSSDGAANQARLSDLELARRQLAAANAAAAATWDR